MLLLAGQCECCKNGLLVINKTEKFKFELDKFLEFIHDEPKMPNYIAAARSNSILDQQSHLKAQIMEFTKVV